MIAALAVKADASVETVAVREAVTAVAPGAVMAEETAVALEEAMADAEETVAVREAVTAAVVAVTAAGAHAGEDSPAEGRPGRVSAEGAPARQGIKSQRFKIDSRFFVNVHGVE